MHTEGKAVFIQKLCVYMFVCFSSSEPLLMVNLYSLMFSSIPENSTFLRTASQRQRIGQAPSKDAAYEHKV